MPQICKYWQLNQCKFGVACRFDHPVNDSSRQHPKNPFAVIQNKTNADSRTATIDQKCFTIDKNVIISDLTSEKPQWVLSAYSPGRHLPAQLFGGYPREQSFEEIRLLYYMASPDQQKLEQTILSTEKLIKESEQQIQHSLQNIDDAVKYLMESANYHPNRVDICRQSESGGVFSAPTITQNQNPFRVTPNQNSLTVQSNQKSLISSSMFGKPSAQVFGAPAAPTGIFGQPSTLGQRYNPFAAVKSNFGAPSQSTMTHENSSRDNLCNGLANNNPNPFAQAATNTFKKFPAFENSGRQNPFGSSSNPAFGAPSSSSVTQRNPKTDLDTQLNPNFNQSSLNPFAVLSNNTKTNTSVVSNLKNPFANPIEPHLNLSDNFKNEPDRVESKVLNSLNSKFSGGTSNHLSDSQMLKSNSPSDSHENPKSFKNRNIEYRDKIPGFINKEGIWERIWFPDGKPKFSEDAKMPLETVYDELTSKAYSYARQNKRFENGWIPALPPKDVWCEYDF
ncbi:Nucleoporin AMO1 [Golovinomyces cichoracearum]|uniref:Nucleoporin AMO1 n=1 Tax=Golovinomyces cichoracearum TaxID=62708 RepID=A0A420IYY5_9PEZI|nr:Nucleoporin AMO1 [Golovinomyces cichoracearum]